MQQKQMWMLRGCRTFELLSLSHHTSSIRKICFDVPVLPGVHGMYFIILIMSSHAHREHHDNRVSKISWENRFGSPSIGAVAYLKTQVASFTRHCRHHIAAQVQFWSLLTSFQVHPYKPSQKEQQPWAVCWGRGNANFQTLDCLAVKENMRDLFSTNRPCRLLVTRSVMAQSAAVMLMPHSSYLSCLIVKLCRVSLLL